MEPVEEHRKVAMPAGRPDEFCQRHGTDCSSAVDACLREMSLPDPGGTVGISKFLVPLGYRTDDRYPRGNVVISHVV